MGAGFMWVRVLVSGVCVCGCLLVDYWTGPLTTAGQKSNWLNQIDRVLCVCSLLCVCVCLSACGCWLHVWVLVSCGQCPGPHLVDPPLPGLLLPEGELDFGHCFLRPILFFDFVG